MRVFLSLGCNIGDCSASFDKVIEALSCISDVVICSKRYRTSPLYVEDQPDFLNMVVEINTSMDALSLLDFLKNLEGEAGRDFNALRYGPRCLDIDILYYGQQIISLPKLSVPHPHISERLFVLRPMAEIAADWKDPRIDCSVAEMLEKCKAK